MSDMVSETGSDPKNWLAATISPANRLLHEHLFLAVVVPGAVGGFISWLLGNKLEAAIFDSPFPAASLSLIFGALAALTFVVVLTNVDKTDTPRLIALAFLAGLAYPPVLQAGVNILGVSTDGLVGFQNQAQEQREVFEDAARRISAKQMDGESLSTLANQSAELANILAELPESERSDFLSSLVDELRISLRP